jgi:glycosyltransferase involved in cell wall biosynthesis
MRAGPAVVVSSSAEHGGAERYLALLVGELARRGPVVALIGDVAARETREALEAAGAEVRTVRGLARRPRPAAALRLAAAIARLRPRVVHLNLTDQGDGLAAIAGAWAAGSARTATLHLALPGRAAGRERLSRLALRRVAPVIGVSDGVGEYLQRAGVRSHVVRNGVPAPVPRPGGREALWGGPPPPVLVGGIGRLDAQKGWDVLCAAAPAIRAAVPEAAVAVVGEGAGRPALEPAAAAAGVRLLGHRPDAASDLTAFDVLVMPSRYEGLSLTAIEGLAAGVPIVASDVPGLRDAVGDAGVLVAPEDPAALATAVVSLLRDPARRAVLSDAGRERAARSFGVERMLRETLAVHALLESA